MKKYRTGGWGDNLIEEIEINRETEKSIFYSDPNWYKGKEQRNAKRSSWMNYWDTWEEAHKYLVEKAEKSVENSKDRLANEEDELQNILNLKKDRK